LYPLFVIGNAEPELDEGSEFCSNVERSNAFTLYKSGDLMVYGCVCARANEGGQPWAETVCIGEWRGNPGDAPPLHITHACDGGCGGGKKRSEGGEQESESEESEKDSSKRFSQPPLSQHEVKQNEFDELRAMLLALETKQSQSARVIEGMEM